MKNLICLIDPQTYGLNRGVLMFGLLLGGALIFGCMKLLAVLHAAGMP